jgi:hypothetical protein
MARFFGRNGRCDIVLWGSIVVDLHGFGKGAAKMARHPGGTQVPVVACSIAPISRLAAKGLCRKATQPAL